MAKKITTDQLKELLLIDATGEGLGEPLQALIASATAGGIVRPETPLRERLARKLWRKMPEDTRLPFKKFLKLVPEIPLRLVPYDSEFPHLVLVDLQGDLGVLVRAVDAHLNDLLGVEWEQRRYVRPDADYFTWIRVRKIQLSDKCDTAWHTSVLASQQGGMPLTLREGLCAFIQHDDFAGNGARIQISFPGSIANSGGHMAMLVRSNPGGKTIVHRGPSKAVQGCMAVRKP